MLWLANLAWKLPPTSGATTRRVFSTTSSSPAEHAVGAPLRTLANGVLIPHFTLFGWIVFLVELVVGLSLLLGLWTRIGALLGVGQALAITLLVVRAPDEWIWTFLLLIAMSLVVALTPSGARLSVDSRLRAGS